jgi:hypothetical protein
MGSSKGLPMAEPENHTLRLLREFRNEFGEFRTETKRDFAELIDRIDNLARMIAGETVVGRYAAAGVDKRPKALEDRVAALEDHR